MAESTCTAKKLLAGVPQEKLAGVDAGKLKVTGTSQCWQYAVEQCFRAADELLEGADVCARAEVDGQAQMSHLTVRAGGREVELRSNGWIHFDDKAKPVEEFLAMREIASYVAGARIAPLVAGGPPPRVQEIVDKYPTGYAGSGGPQLQRAIASNIATLSRSGEQFGSKPAQLVEAVLREMKNRPELVPRDEERPSHSGKRAINYIGGEGWRGLDDIACKAPAVMGLVEELFPSEVFETHSSCINTGPDNVAKNIADRIARGDVPYAGDEVTMQNMRRAVASSKYLDASNAETLAKSNPELTETIFRRGGARGIPFSKRARFLRDLEPEDRDAIVFRLAMEDAQDRTTNVSASTLRKLSPVGARLASAVKSYELGIYKKLMEETVKRSRMPEYVISYAIDNIREPNELIEIAARYGDMSEGIMLEAIEEVGEDAAHIIFANTHINDIPTPVLIEMLRHRDWDWDSNVAIAEEIDFNRREVIQKLDLKNDAVAEALISRRYNIPDDILANVVSQNEDAAEMVLRRKELPEEVLNAIAERAFRKDDMNLLSSVASHPAATPNVLSNIASSADPDVMRDVVRSENADAGVLLDAVNEIHEHGNYDAYEDALADAASSDQINPEVADALIATNVPRVLDAVLTNPGVPASTALALLDNGDPEIREVARVAAADRMREIASEFASFRHSRRQAGSQEPSG